jgi:hypothetical protein
LLLHFLHARRGHDLHAHRHGGHVDLDFPLLQRTFAQHLAKALPGIGVAGLCGFIGGEPHWRAWPRQ